MCGITGFWNWRTTESSLKLKQTVKLMCDQLVHRGPDDEGVWAEEQMGIVLGHRRLAIIDLSSEGHQPMLSADGRYVIVFNGEIYNFQEIRQDLTALGHKFRGHSDTEVILASFCQWGIKLSLAKFVGMFAFALWDRQERELSLARDRLGEKPLYYGWLSESFVFASELKALKVHPQWQCKINRDSLTLFLRYNYIPTPHTVYQGIYKLLPGTVLTLKAPHLNPQPLPYWSMESVVEAGLNYPFTGSTSEAITLLDQRLRQAIAQQMIADVPLGAFLSGGIDSSTVVALMQSQSSQKIKTFSIGFAEESYNEAQHAKVVANYLQTDHTELYITPQEARNVIPKLPSLYDEPFADFSQIPTFIVAQLAKQKVTVSLSGDGGDELFGGYNRYFWGNNIWQKIGWTSPAIRQIMSKILTTVSPSTWTQIGEKFLPFLPSQLQIRLLGDKIQKLAEVLAVPNQFALYQGLISHWRTPEAIVIDGKEPITKLQKPPLNLANFCEQMMYLDTITYLSDDILTKVDRAAMGVSLETRIPFLDHRVVEFAWSLPLSLKINQNQGKWLLKQVLYQYVPPELIERPKSGFTVPIDCWLRTTLKDWADSLLNSTRLEQEGFFYAPAIQQKWQEHLSGKRNCHDLLWSVLIFQSWLQENHF